MSKEGSLEAPKRLPILWQSPDYTDQQSLEQEMARQFDVCHGCRRCFNLCDAFPTLFDLIDQSESGEVDSLLPEDYAKVTDACTLCDMCYMTKCPYVPPHPFQIDFPHLLLRHKAYQYQQKQVGFVKKELAKVDRNAQMVTPISSVVNRVIDESSPLRSIVEKTTGIDKSAWIPKFSSKPLMRLLKETPHTLNPKGIAFKERVILYATCYGNYHETQIGMAAVKILRFLGVDVDVHYPGCCGMPQLEIGHLEGVFKKAKNVALYFKPFLEQNVPIITLIPSCGFMLKSEWPCLAPDDLDIQSLKIHTQDIFEYLANLFDQYGLPPEMQENERFSEKIQVILHHACHARAQNMGMKANEVLKKFPNMTINTIERCSGHGGTWGMMKAHHETALQVGKPVIKQTLQALSHNHTDEKIISSECPLAAQHIRQGFEKASPQQDIRTAHPLEILCDLLGLSTNPH